MGLGNIAKKAKDYLGNKENHGKINETIDKARKQHGSKLGKHGEKVNKFVDGQQDKRFGGGAAGVENPDPRAGEGPGSRGDEGQRGGETPPPPR